MLIDRYLIREIVKPFAAVCALLVIVFVVYSSSERLGDAVAGLQGLPTILTLLGLEALIALEVLLPMALYLSVVFGLATLASRGEVRAMQAAGMPLARLLRPVAVAALPVVLLVALLSLHARPWAYTQMFRIEDQAQSRIDTSQIQPGHFYPLPGGEKVLLATGRGKGSGDFRGMFLHSREGGQQRVITARRAEISGLGEGKLEPLRFGEGHLYHFDREGTDLISRFGRMVLDPGQPEPPSLEDERKANPTFELARSQDPVFLAELQWRLSTPLSALLMAFIGTVLGARGPEHNRSLKVLGAAILYGIYYNLTGMGRNLMEQGLLGAVPGIWWVHLLLVVGLFATLFRPAHRWWRWQSL